jgi:RNA polymerase sigma-70 factor (ECF subfamily)
MSSDQILSSESESASFNEKFDDAAFEMLFKSHFASLCAFCQYKFGFDLDQSKEVVHIAFIKLWETRFQITSYLSVKSYLYKVVTNNCLDVLKHEKVRTRHEKRISNNSSATCQINEFYSTDIKELTADINKAIAELPEQMRKIFELSRNEGMKYADIASQLDISVKTVETQMSRALIKLRQKLADYLISIFIALAVSDTFFL